MDRLPGMGRAFDLRGLRFGRWQVVSLSERVDKSRRKFWNCLCDCGTEKTVLSTLLVRGESVSCGCFQSDEMRRRSTKHGRVNSRTYRAWGNMLTRCFNEKHNSYRNYGGRGVTVCDEWRVSFAAFLRDAGDCPDGMSLDRIDSGRGYEPGNVRWATQKQQSRNKRNTIRLTANGRTLSLDDWAEELCVSRQLIRSRLDRGWSHERALTEPRRSRRSKWETCRGVQ